MTVMAILGGVVALGLGVYIGLGYPGMPGRDDRIVHRRPARRRTFTPLDWLRPPKH